MREKGADPQLVYTYSQVCRSELALGLRDSWAEFTSDLEHPCPLVAYSCALRPQRHVHRRGPCAGWTDVVGKSLCLDSLLGKKEIAKHVAMMAPRLFTHARAGLMWE